MAENSKGETVLLTPAWRGDWWRVATLRLSLEHFGLADAPHALVVHTEDIEQFEPLAKDGVALLSTAEVLPPDIERSRRAFVQRTAGMSRHAVRWRRSLNKRFGWFSSVRYAGWQTQQLTKLAAPLHLGAGRALVLDADTLLSAPLQLEDCVEKGQTVQIRSMQPLRQDVIGLAHRWALTAHRQLGLEFNPNAVGNSRVGTPFILDSDVLAEMLHTLGRDTWAHRLLNLRPGEWSEFAFYNCFARHCTNIPLATQDNNPAWRTVVVPWNTGNQRAEQAVRDAFNCPDTRFLTIQSDARNYARADGQQWFDLISSLLDGDAKAS